MAFLAAKAPEQLDTVARIHAIPIKERAKPQVMFLTPAEVQALLDAIHTDTWTGRRDRAIFTLAAQTGLRLSELTNLSPAFTSAQLLTWPALATGESNAPHR